MNKPIHGEPVPFHELHNLSATPPIPCAFKLGDEVIFTNDQDGQWKHTVRGFAKTAGEYGRFVFVFPDTDAWWFPVKPESLQPATA